jgi:hypothetical protein
MHSDIQGLTQFELDVFDKLLCGDTMVLQILNRQLESATIRSREYTGVGFFLNFDVPNNELKVDESIDAKQNFNFGGVEAIIGKDKQEVGFRLIIRNGFLDFLEAYTYGSDPWPVDIESYTIRYTGNYRNLDKLIKRWKY